MSERLLIEQLRTPKKVVQTLSDDQVRRILAQKPKSFRDRRAYVIACTLIDTGLRIDEALGLTPADVIWTICSSR